MEYEFELKLSAFNVGPNADANNRAGIIAPAPSSAEVLRQIASDVKGDFAFALAGILTRAADELDGQFEALKLAVGMLTLHGYEGDAKKVVAESKRWKGEADAPHEAGN
jgi:hypothetical protein